MSSSLWPLGLQHTRPPCPSQTPGVCSDSGTSGWWCHPTIFPSVRVFSNESVLPIRWPKYRSFSFSISPFNEDSGLISLGFSGLISLQSKGLSRVFSNTTVQKHQFFGAQLSLWPNSHIHTCCCCWVASVVSDSVWPHRRQPTRLPCPWDSPGKNTGVGCHFLLQCVKVKSESEVAQSCPTRSNTMDCSLPGSSVHGIF